MSEGALTGGFSRCYLGKMRGKTRWASLGTFVLVAVLAGCGDDDDSVAVDGGRDSGDASGRGGAAGGDAGRADVTPDSGPITDASADPDGPGIADSSVDRVDSDGRSVFDGFEETGGPPRNDAADAPDVDTRDGSDVASIDASGDADGSGGDVSDATSVDTADAT